MSSWSVTSLGDSIAEFASIAGESLLFYDESIWQTYVRRVGSENIRCLWSGGTMVGGLAFYRMGQFYGGRRIACAGVSGVGIDPAHRGSGACKALLSETLKELHREEMPLACLYASTRTLYRSVGFEISGHQIQYALKMHSFRPTKDDRELPVTRATKPEFSVLDRLNVARGCVNQGGIDRTDGLWERIVEPLGRTTSTYLIGEAESPQGFVTLIHGKREFGHPQPLVATDCCAVTPQALRRLIALLVDHRSMHDCFHWNGGTQDPLIMAANEEHLEIKNQLHTLNRIVHLRAALERRGYPQGLQGEIHFDIIDEVLEENSGRWVLELDGSGQAKLGRGGQGKLQANARDLVPLFTSMHRCSQLVAMGRILSTDRASVNLTDAAFSGPAPWTVELF